MTSSRSTHFGRGGWVRACLFVLALLGASQSWAILCSALPNHTLDGFAGDVPPDQIKIDTNCTIRNYPASNPLTTNFSFLTQPGQTQERWLVIFDNVVHTGQMACNSVAGHKIWFVNGSSSSIQQGCQNLLIPVEKIDKKNPAGSNDTATVGVPFTYTLTIPVLFDSATGTVVDFQGSPNDLHSIVITDDLNATGADLTYLSHVVYWKDSGLPVSHTFSNVGGVLTFGGFPIVPAGEQIIIEVTVVLNNSPTNVIGNQFINTAKWEFGRLIDGVFYEPLPGEWGISDPMTIAAPNLVMTKTGPATLNLGQGGDFVLDVENAGLSDAWNVSLLDRLPNGPSGGMCDLTPQITSAGVYSAGGTPVPGKGSLVAGTDFTVSYSGAPTCELRLTMLTPAAVIGAGEHLIVHYQTSLDPRTQQAATLTNVAGAVEWFNGPSSAAQRLQYTRTLTNGTVGTADHEDAHTVTADLHGYIFEKTVADVTSGTDPATTAEPGDTLRYTLYIRTTDTPLVNARIFDDLGAMNATPVFASGSLTLVGALPPGATGSGTDPTGGTNGAGIVDIRGLNLPADSNATMQFDVKLEPVISDGTVVTNQAGLFGVGKITDSDDPNVNGQSDPDVFGDEDPTRVLVHSVPELRIEKVSTYLDGDPNVLLAGEHLRYTITVSNVGTADAVDVRLRDAIPANTSYVAGSTRLNGSPLADGAGGAFPLSNGVDVNAPSDPTPGSLPADAAAAADNVATIQFDVQVDPSVADGTVISNQAFVSAVSGGVIDQPSDDPRTVAVNDPTLDVVGNFPLVFAVKTAALQVDQSSPGIVDPGDYLRYTILVQNNGPVPATMVRVKDVVPTNTTYVADTFTLNGLPVGQPDNGVFPMAAGVWVSSSDLTPPLPATADDATLSPREVATIQFDVRVDDNTPRGTLITNQATVTTAELGDQLTDGDGNPATGPEPTVVVVGDAQQLQITKQVAVVGGGPALAGSTLQYVVSVRNASAVPATGVYITDNLDDPVAGQVTYVAGSATMNGGTAGIDVTNQVITANYSAQYGPLAPGRSILLQFQVHIDDQLPIGTTITNIADATWNTDQTVQAMVSIDVGGTPGSGILSGSVWHDADFDDVEDAGELPLQGWTVELRRNDQVIRTAITDAAGSYRMPGLVPNYNTQDRYDLTFRAPGSGPRTALLGLASSDFTNKLQRIYDIVVRSGSNIVNLNLPIDPNGVVYDALSRLPLAGATLTLVDTATGSAVAADCFDDPNQQGQVTLSSGYYKFDLNFSDPSCPSGGRYTVVATPPANYETGVSELIPPSSDATTNPFDVPACAAGVGDAVPGTSGYCEAQSSEFAPASSVAPQTPGTAYYLNLLLNDTQTPGTSQIFNNHIPLDPVLSGLVTVTKTTPMVNVTRGQLVPYTIEVHNTYPIDLAGVDVVDRFPVGFKYIKGSARFNGQPLEPTLADGELAWRNLTLTAQGDDKIELLLAPGAGVVEGEYTNRAQAELALTSQPLSGEASATVRLVPDPTFDCTDVTGKVFEDDNRNGVQDNGEPGIPAARLVSPTGVAALTDAQGRFHITCAITPREGRGSNFMLKLDDRTLPAGYRPSTSLFQIKRATRGKALHFSFGASIHRVVGLEIADAVFEPGTTEMRPQWKPRLDLLMDELKKGPAVLRLTYLADVEAPGLVDRRVEAMTGLIRSAWDELNCCYRLAIEHEVFWRMGKPPAKDPRLTRRRAEP